MTQFSKNTAKETTSLVCRKDGLYRRSPRGKFTRIAGRLRVLSRARDSNSANWSRLVELINGDGKLVRRLLPEKLLKVNGSKQIFSELADVGFELPEKAEDRTAFLQYLRDPEINPRTTIVRANGYVSDWVYLLGSQVIGAKSRDFFPDTAIEADPNRYEVRGTLVDWQRDMASFVAGNALPMVAIMAAFVGPIIKPLGLENGGIQFFGASSLGKTALLSCAASVLGPPSEGAMVSWATTVNGLDDLALARSDSVLVIDETASAADQNNSPAGVILPAIYRLCGGIEKARKHIGIAPKPLQARWRIFVISSSEKSVPELASAAGQELLTGGRVRFIDIAADAEQGLGVFDQLPEGIATSRELTDELKLRSEKSCGTAQREFLKRFLKELKQSKEDLRQYLDRRIDAFRKQAQVQGFDGAESRIATHFAAIHAAGCLAAKYGVLPWSRTQMGEACLRCYRGVIERHVSENINTENEIKERVRSSWEKIRPKLGRLKKGRGPGTDPKDLGWLKTSPSGVDEIILKQKTFSKLCGNVPAVSRMLADKGVLVRNTDGKPTVQRAIPGIKAARGLRYFVLDRRAFRAWRAQKNA
jgi:putative DNA primase/helicase